MCLIGVSRDDEPTQARPVTYVRRRPSHHSHRSSIIIRPVSGTIVPAGSPRPSEYILAPPANGRVSMPHIVHAPTPPRSPQRSPRVSGVIIQSSPRSSRGSLQSRNSRQGHHSRHGSAGGEVIYLTRSQDRSRAGSVSRPLSRERTRDGSRERSSRVYLTAPTELEVAAASRGLEASRQSLYLDDAPRRRSRSITYETNPRISVGRLSNRERIVIEEDGRRTETYRIAGTS